MANVEAQPDEAGAKLIQADETSKSRPALAGLTRGLSDEDLKSPGAQKLLLDSLVRVEEENAALRRFQEKFHESDKNNAVLEERLKTRIAFEIISTGTLAIGSAALGYARSLTSTPTGGYWALGFGLFLVSIGIWAKVIRR